MSNTQETNRGLFRWRGGSYTGIQKDKAKETISREEMICKLKQIKEEVSKYEQILPLVLE